MRFLRRLVFGLFFLSIALLIFLPPLIGLNVQNLVRTGKFIPGLLQGQIELETLSYTRGWFSSDVILVAKITDLATRKLLLEWGIPIERIPASIIIFLPEHIQHGPIFYHPLTHWPTFFGLAAIENQVIFPSKQKEFFSNFGLNNSTVKNSQILLTYGRKIFSHIELINLQLLFPHINTVMAVSNIEANMIQPLASQKAQADIAIKQFTLQAADTVFSVPEALVKFDLQKDTNGFWVGQHSISLPAIILNDAGQHYAVQAMRFNGLLKETAGLFAAEKAISFKKMQLQNQTIGPFNFQIAAGGINAQAITNLISTYIDIQQNGELYESQLRKKLLAILPHAIAAGATVTLNQCDVATQYGAFKLKGKLGWPRENFTAPGSLKDVIKSSTVEASLRISITLVEQLMNEVTRLFFMRQLSADDNLQLDLLQENINFISRQNSAAIIDYIQSQQLSDRSSTKLLKMVRNKADLAEYKAQIQTLFLTKKITREASYLLNNLFNSLSLATDAYKQQISHFEMQAKKLLRAELDAYVTEDLIIKEKDDYVCSIQMADDKLKINGKILRRGI